MTPIIQSTTGQKEPQCPCRLLDLQFSVEACTDKPLHPELIGQVQLSTSPPATHCLTSPRDETPCPGYRPGGECRRLCPSPSAEESSSGLRHIGVESEKAKSSRHRAKAHCCSALLWVTASSLLAPLALAPLRQELQAPPLVLHPPESRQSRKQLPYEYGCGEVREGAFCLVITCDEVLKPALPDCQLLYTALPWNYPLLPRTKVRRSLANAPNPAVREPSPSQVPQPC